MGVLAAAAALATLGVSLDAHALALGAAKVRSALGQPLRAEIEVPQISSEEASTFKAKMASPQAFQNAGVEYNAALSGAQVSLQRRPNGQAYLRITSDRPIDEPFLGIVIEADWNGGNIVRDYTMLLDPPSTPPARPVAVTEPQTAPSSRANARNRPAVAEQVMPSGRASRRASRRGAAAADADSDDTGAAGGGGQQVTVQRGNTAYGIASAHAIDGVSLDQMLVAMLRANPRAFINGNVNLIRAGAVIHMPTAEQAAAVSRKSARRTVVAQTRDFNAYRHGLASRVRPSHVASAGRRVSGAVQSHVQESRPAATAEDRLILPQGGAPSGAESKVAQSRQAKEQADRAAELERNLKELASLQGASAPDASKTGTTPAIEVATGAIAPTPPAAPASEMITPMPAASDAAASSMADNVASAASEVSAMITPEETPAPAPAPKPRAPVVVAEPEPESSLMDTVMENALPIAGGVGILALLAGLGLYKARKGKKKTASLDSAFIENRLQPDSFFGSSGGQHINTKEDTGNLSMSYSPSQLDAAGDVDPVAEADVYLAYNRDLQAEEILREALHTQPERISIHRKLAEIYAKRLDARAFEATAIQAHRITHGEGADWMIISQLGAELDPSNPLYKPGGSPAPRTAAAPAHPAPSFGADTEPQTAQVADSTQQDTAANPGMALDLDLGLDQAPVRTAAAPAPQPSARAAAPAAAAVAVVPPAIEPKPSLDEPLDFSLDMDLSPTPSPAPAPAPAAKAPAPAAPQVADTGGGMIDFDMGALSVDPDSRSTAELHTEQPEDADDDPLGTKLALAQEFHAIGDTDGARTMVKEVIAESTGALRARAERFLAEIG